MAKGKSVKESIEELPDGRVRIVREVCGMPVSIIFSAQEDNKTLENIKAMIMDAYAERKLREGKLSNCDQLFSFMRRLTLFRL